MDWITLAVLFLLFAGNTVVQYRLGFKAGARGGYTVGIWHTVKYLMDRKYLDCENKDTGEPATPVEIAKYILAETKYQQMDEHTAVELTK